MHFCAQYFATEYYLKPVKSTSQSCFLLIQNFMLTLRVCLNLKGFHPFILSDDIFIHLWFPPCKSAACFVHLDFLEMITQNTRQYINFWSSSQKFSVDCCYFLPLKLEHLPQYPVFKHTCLFDNIYFSYYSTFLRHFVLFPNKKYTALYLKTHDVLEWPNSMITDSF